MSSTPGSTNHEWLHREVGLWASEGIISETAAAQLIGRYPLTAAKPAPTRSAHWIMVLFGIIGAVLVGGGIILLLAHNWEQMSRPTRAAVAFVPLVLSQVLAFCMLWTGRGRTWGRECVGTFIALMAGACIALISQTYHLGGDFAEFMLVWTLLSLPVAYLMRAILPAIWFCVATVVWVCSLDWGHRGEEVWFWPLLVLVVPLWWMEVRRDRYHPRAVLLGWAMAAAGSIGTVICCDRSWQVSYWMLASAGWYVFLYLTGKCWFAEGRTMWHRPFQWVGALGAAVVALILTFDWQWRRALDYGNPVSPWAAVPVWIASCGWVVPALLLWIWSILRRDVASIVVGALPVLIIAVIALPALDGGPTNAIFNVYVFATGLALLVSGVRAQRLGTVNGGMAIISALVLCRFFDTEMSFILRGVVFILLGVGFIITNFILLRRKGAVP